MSGETVTEKGRLFAAAQEGRELVTDRPRGEASSRLSDATSIPTSDAEAPATSAASPLQSELQTFFSDASFPSTGASSPATHNEQKAFMRECLSEALLQLMKVKKYDAISVSEIAARAGVSRMTYYRNFSSKDELLMVRLDALFASFFMKMRTTEDLSIHDLALGFCAVFYAERDFIDAMVAGGVSNLILQRFVMYMDMLYQHILNNRLHVSATRYECAYVAGGLYMALLEWAKGGFEESPEMMARTIQGLTRQF